MTNDCCCVLTLILRGLGLSALYIAINRFNSFRVSLRDKFACHKVEATAIKSPMFIFLRFSTGHLPIAVKMFFGYFVKKLKFKYSTEAILLF